MPSPITTLRDEIRATAVRLFAYLCGIAALAILAAEVFQSAPVVAAVEPVAPPDWITIERPAPAFEANLPELSAEAHYIIQRHTRGGGRKDIISFGEPGRSARYAMLEIYRPGAELPHFADPSIVIASQAGEFDSAGTMRTSLPIASKFGKMTSVDFAVGRYGAGHCVGFVRQFNAPRLQIAGMSCSMDTLVDRAAVTCMLDRLTLLSSGNDPRIAGIFARAEVNREFCGQRDPLMYATPKRGSPGDGNHASVKLRGSLASR